MERVVQEMVSDGLLKADGDRLEWAMANPRVPVPEQTRTEMFKPLSQVPAAHRRVLEALAVLGEEGDEQILAGALACSHRQLRPALVALESRGWITYEDRYEKRQIRWRQPLSRDIVLARLRPSREHILRCHLADLLSNAPPSSAQIRLLLAAGNHAEAVNRGVELARHHLARDFPRSGLQTLEPLMDCVEQLRDIPPGRMSRMLIVWANCQLAVDPSEPRIGPTLRRAAEVGSGRPFLGELALTRARHQRALGHYRHYQRFLDIAWRHLEEADENDNSRPHLQLAVAWQLGLYHTLIGEIANAGDWYVKGQEIARRTGQDRLISVGDVGMARWLLASGMLRRAEETLRPAIDIFESSKDIYGMSLALPTWAELLRHQGRISEALSVLSRNLTAFRSSQAPSLYVRILLALAWCEVDLHRLGRAQECVDELGANLRAGEHLHLRLEAMLVQGRISLMSGELRDAWRVLRQVMEQAELSGLKVLAGNAQALSGEVLWHGGRRKEAHRAFLSANNCLRAAGHLPALTDACIAQMRSMGGPVDPKRLLAPVSTFVDGQPALIAKLEQQLACARHLVEIGRDPRRAWADARTLLRQLSHGLDPTDRAALRVHPWSREILAGVGR